MATGEFEGKSLAALNAMVAKADPGLLTSRGQALGKAGSDMDGIGSELRTYIDRVEWDGEGGDAFREWGRQFALESMRFAAYVRTLGQHMVNAGQALTEAKAAIPEPEMCYADPEKDKARQEREESKRQEAINQLNRLSSYYRTTGEALRAAEEPDFKPLPDGKQHEGSGNSAPGAASGSGSTAYREQGTNPDRSATGQVGTDGRYLPGTEHSTPVFDRPTNTKLDSVAPLPVAEQRPQTVTPMPPQQSASPPSPPVAPMPPTGPAQQTGRAPNGGRPSVGGGGGSLSPRGPVKDGIMGGTPRHAGNPASGTGTPRGTVAGDRAPMGRPMGGYPGAAGGGAPTGRGMLPGRPFAPSPGSPGGTPRTGGASRSASFTPGGTGLVRGNTAPGVAGRPAGTNAPSENRRRGQDRPDYLAEDEETWAGRRDVVPPVID
ncbi:WXG100 family type VII secretion target [Streptomyces fenghuangensis]